MRARFSRFFSSKISPMIFFIACLGFTFWGWHSAQQAAHNRNRERFDNLCQEITSSIREKVEVYVDALYGARGLYAASKTVERDEWHAYVSELDMEVRYPGLVALQYLERVKREDLPAYLQKIKGDKALSAEDSSNFSIFPAGDREEYWPITYLEPFELNKKVFGKDELFDKERYGTLANSLDTGEISFSGKSRLTRFEDKPPGFLIVLPVFKNGMPADSAADRHENFQGFVAGVIRAQDFFEVAYNKISRTWALDFEIYSESSSQVNNLLYDSNSVPYQEEEEQFVQSFVLETEIEIGGKKLVLHFWADPKKRASKYERLFPTYVLGSGIIFSILLYFFLVMLVFGRERAEKFAEEKHKDLIEEIVIRKRAEEKTREAMRVKSDFTSTVSHELRTPLTVIKESLSIVHDGSAGPLNEDQVMFLDKAQKNVERLARLINDVLDYQKIEAGKAVFNKVLGDLNEVVKEVVDDYHEVALKQGMDIELYLDPAMPQVHFDRDKIIQVIGNFLNNAIKFGQEGKIFVSTDYDNNAVKVSVADNGPGIKAEEKEKLFQSFSQLGESNDRKTGGTGLGLVICKRIIEAHGGKVGVDSVYHKGATFYFMIPVIERRMMDGR